MVLDSSTSARRRRRFAKATFCGLYGREDYALLKPHLGVLALCERPRAVQTRGQRRDGVLSVRSQPHFVPRHELRTGRDVETILIGREGAVGGIVSLGNLPAYCRVVVKFGGQFSYMPVSQLEAAKGAFTNASFTVRALC